MSRRVLITGGSGFVGSSLGLGLAQRHPDWQITVLDNLRRRGSELNLPGSSKQVFSLFMVISEIQKI